MTLLDFILNIAGLLIWLGWCGRRIDPLSRRVPATLVGTLRPAESSSVRGWHFLLGLAALLFVRSAFYFEIASAVGWTPKINCGLVVLAFPADRFGPCGLYSVLSFGRVLLVYYFWVAVLLLVNGASSEAEPVLKLLRPQFGPIGRWPGPVLLCLPVLAAAAVWVGIYKLLAHLNVLGHSTWPHVIEQGFLLSLVLLLSLKYLLATVLLLDLAASYVYLGQSPVWDFIRSTARSLLVLVRWIPLRWGKIDLAPAAAILVLLLLLHWGPQILDTRLTRAGIAIWPN